MIGINPRELMTHCEEITVHFEKGLNDEEIFDEMGGKIQVKQISAIRRLLGLRKTPTARVKKVSWKHNGVPRIQAISLKTQAAEIGLIQDNPYEVHIINTKPMQVTLEFRPIVEGA